MNDRDKIRDLIVTGPPCQTYNEVDFISKEIEALNLIRAAHPTACGAYQDTSNHAHHAAKPPASGLLASVRARILNPTHRSTR